MEKMFPNNDVFWNEIRKNCTKMLMFYHQYIIVMKLIALKGQT